MSRAGIIFAAVAWVLMCFGMGVGTPAPAPQPASVPSVFSPNCPPGQWYVDKPGSGWECAPGTSEVYTPAAWQASPGGDR